MWPHRRQPTRLCHPWDSPGKNTGVGCHFLLQCIKVKGESEVAQSCLTLSNPVHCSLPGSSIHGIFQARVLEWGAIAFSVGQARIRQYITCLSEGMKMCMVKLINSDKVWGIKQEKDENQSSWARWEKHSRRTPIQTQSPQKGRTYWPWILSPRLLLTSRYNYKSFRLGPKSHCQPW